MNRRSFFGLPLVALAPNAEAHSPQASNEWAGHLMPLRERVMTMKIEALRSFGEKCAIENRELRARLQKAVEFGEYRIKL